MGPAGPRPESERRSLTRSLLIGPKQPPGVRMASLATAMLMLVLLRFVSATAAVVASPVLFGALLVFMFRSERRQRLRWQAERTRSDV